MAARPTGRIRPRAWSWAARALAGLLAVVCVLLRVAAAADIGLPWAGSPEEMNMDGGVLQELTRQLQNLTDHRLIPGAMVMISRRGKLVYQARVGFEHDDLIFRIFSMSKPIAAAAVLLLVQDGKLRLDDPLCKFCPQFCAMRVIAGEHPSPNWFQTVPARSQITVQQLLTHSSGLVYGYGNTTVDLLYRRANLLPYVWKAESLEAFASAVARQPLLFHPGTHTHYSLGFDIAGYLIQQASGMPLECFLRQRIFEPLGMSDTDFWVPPEKAHRLVPLRYHRRDGSSIRIPDSELAMNGYLREPRLKLAGSGLVTTAQDYMRFAQMMFDGGLYTCPGTGQRQRLLRADLAERLLTDQVAPSLKPFTMNGMAHPNLTLALGAQVQVVETEASPKGEVVFGGMANTKLVLSRERELVMLALTQKVPYPNQVANFVHELVYSAQRDFPRKHGIPESVMEETVTQDSGGSILQRIPVFKRENPYAADTAAAQKARRLRRREKGEAGGGGVGGRERLGETDMDEAEEDAAAWRALVAELAPEEMEILYSGLM